MTQVDTEKLREIASRIREMREICGFTESEMAEKSGVSLDEYIEFEAGEKDFPYTFIHKCALAFGVGIIDLLEGHPAHLSLYTITRKGQGHETAKEEGIVLKNLAPMFQKKISEPYWVKYDYKPELLDKPIHTTTHYGQEFDYVLKGRLKVRIGDYIEYLSEGDSIYYNSTTPHGMIAVDGEDCYFLAVVLPGEKQEEHLIRNTFMPSFAIQSQKLVCSKFINAEEDENGMLKKISFNYANKFNFAFDIVDEIGKRKPNKLAMIHVAEDGKETQFNFRDIKRASAQAANYFKALGIQKGDKVMLVLKRRYQFWFSMLGLHKLGAIAIPATSQLHAHDFEYRFKAAEIKAIVSTGDETVPEIEEAERTCGYELIKIFVGIKKKGWHNFDEEFPMYSPHFYRNDDTPCGDDPMFMIFTSGTTGYPKAAIHSHKYALGHYVTAKYWHGASEGGLHLTISETGWAKSLWGKLYGQWMCECAVFVYDFDRFDAAKILPLFAKYKITTFCAPPTMLRMLIRQDISKYDLSSIAHMTTAGEALNPEVHKLFLASTGLRINESFGQSETTMVIGNLIGDTIKVGSMGKPSPLYDVTLMTKDGGIADTGEIGEIVIKTSDNVPCGLFSGYYNDYDATKKVWHDGYYHTRDLAWRDEEGFYWYIGRTDDVIKSSGYRIGPFEIENVIMELPYVLECGVSAAPDDLRGQVVKASIVLTHGTKPTEELKKEIQDYVKQNTAPYKYPRIIVFRDSLPKTVSGKIQRAQL